MEKRINWNFKNKIEEGTKVITKNGKAGIAKGKTLDGNRFVHFLKGSSKAVDPSNLVLDPNSDFHLYGTKVYEFAAQNGKLHKTPLRRNDLYTKVGATTKDQKYAIDKVLIEDRLRYIDHIEFVSNPDINYDTYRIDKLDGNIIVENAPIQPNSTSFDTLNDGKYGFTGSYLGIDIIENFLFDLFEEYTPFIKQWLALYTFTNFKPTPTLVLFGPRGTGKSKFAELVSNIYPNMATDWNGEDNHFTPEYRKKCLVIEENTKLSKKQYRTLKKVSGSATLLVNEKNEKPYEVRNNTNLILISNNPLPMYVESSELPTNKLQNQFFVYRFGNKIENPDPNILDDIKEHLGAWIQTELRQIWEGMTLEGRYSIPVPITQWERKLFENNVTRLEDAAKDFLDDLLGELRKYKKVDSPSQRRGFIYEHSEEIENLLELLLDDFMATQLVREFGPNNYSSTDIKKQLYERGILGNNKTKQIAGMRRRGKEIISWPGLEEFKEELKKIPANESTFS